MLKKAIYFFIILSSSLLAEGSKYQTTEYKNFAKYIELVNEYIFISSYSEDSASLKCKLDEISIPAYAYQSLSFIGSPWQDSSWLCVRNETSADSNYHFDKHKFSQSLGYGRKIPKIDLPIVLRVGSFAPRNLYNRCGTQLLRIPNQFSIPITDSTAVSLHISRIIDGESFREYIMVDGKWSKNPEPDSSVPHDVKYRAIVTSGRTKCSGNTVDNQFTATFNSKPEYRLFLMASGEAVFVIWGDDVPTPGSEENGGVTVHEVVIMEHGGHLKAELHDIYQGEKAVRWTEYTIEKGLLRRKVYDNSTKFPQVFRLLFRGGWAPDNEGK